MLTPSDYWDREVTVPVTPPSHSWMAHPEVRHYINRSIGGGEGTWPLDWFQKAYPDRVFRRALSIGCGTGALERDLAKRGIVERIEAFDASPASIEIATKLAADEGLAERIHYTLADFNTVQLSPSTYDFICFHQSLHHVQELEHLLEQVLTALVPDGILYLDEFVGPSRDYWNEARIRWYRALYQFFPREFRHFDEFAMPIQEEDPSEAIRSSEILSRLLIGFDIENFRGYGGNILAMMFPDLLVHKLTEDQVLTMIDCEKALIAAGAPHFHAIIVARPRTGTLQRLFARSRYKTESTFPGATTWIRSLIRSLRGRSESFW